MKLHKKLLVGLLVLALLAVLFPVSKADFGDDDAGDDDAGDDDDGGDDDFSYGPRRPLHPCNLKGPLPDSDPDYRPACDLVADYLVVGTGAGGAPIIRKLSDNFAYSVLAFEAGENRDEDPNVFNPFNSQVVSSQSYSTYCWQMASAYEESVGKKFEISIGRMFGGSTSHNGMQYVRGSPQFFADWQARAGPNWSPASINLAYKQMERYVGRAPIASTRGTTGPLSVRGPAVGPTSGTGSLAYKLANWTAAATGMPVLSDYNDPTNPARAFGPFPRFDLFETPDGNRSSSSTSFLPKSVVSAGGIGVGARKLRILFKSTVTRVIFEGNVAVGVEFLRAGRLFRAWARREVILAASLFSTQILQNSGIGPASRLTPLGVPVKVNNPHVGEHLFNHQSLFMFLTYNPAHLPGLVPSDPQALYPGGVFFPSMKAAGPVNASELTQPRKYQLIWVAPQSEFAPLLAFIIQLRPKSEGYDRIQSNDPLQVPLHKENVFSDPDDLNDFASFLFYGIQNTVVAHMHSKDPAYGLASGWGASGAIPWNTWTSVEDAKAFVRANLAKSYHYTTQNRMSTSAADGVVSPTGRVWGVENLTVADSTVIPSSPDGNVGAPAMVVGWKIADYIIARR